MTVRDTLLREHRFLDRLLERLENSLRLESSIARAESKNLLILLAPCLDAHLDVERIVFRGRSDRPQRSPVTDPALRLKSLQAELKALLEHGHAEPFQRYRDGVLRLISNVRSRFQAEGSWAPRHQARPVDVVRRMTRHVQSLERDVESRSAVIEDYVRRA